MFSNANLNSFLKLGYFLNYKNPTYSFDFSNVNKLKYKDYTEEELIKIGSVIWMKAVTNRFNNKRNHVVPISGGLDSRAILAGLLECTEAKNISTYTFGTPGTLDYDIGNYVAEKMGTMHMKFSLTEYEYNVDELIDISSKVDHQTVLFHHPPVQQIESMFGKSLYWSGFMGGELAGSHLEQRIFEEVREAKSNFVSRNTYVKKINISNSTDSEIYHLIEDPNYATENLALEEQLDFQNRQLKFIAPHVLMQGFNYIIPFLDQEWMDFILSVERKYRYNQYLYKKILSRTFPKAFSYKTKSHYGLPLSAGEFRVFMQRAKDKVQNIVSLKNSMSKRRNLNYIDFNYGIRSRNDLNKVVYENIMDLKKRKVVEWIDIDEIWKNHIKYNRDLAKALIILTSLEIHYKAKEINQKEELQ
ncbi:MAG: asparagine synthase-related protein [bacterium]